MKETGDYLVIPVHFDEFTSVFVRLFILLKSNKIFGVNKIQIFFDSFHVFYTGTKIKN